jgi:Ca2+-binding RTX toxin-like protein
MAKANVFPAIGDWNTIDEWFEANVTLSDFSKTSATWSNPDNFYFFEMEGTKLKFENGVLVSGKVESITFHEAEGLKMTRIAGDFDAAELGAAVEYGGVDALVMKAMSGDDKVIGGAEHDFLEGHNGNDRMKGGLGDDSIWGGRGNDVLTGGKGTDWFHFDWSFKEGFKNGDDIVTDFDASSGPGMEDAVSGLDIKKIRQVGDDTVVEYKSGGSMTLLDVDKHDLGEGNFHYPL